MSSSENQNVILIQKCFPNITIKLGVSFKDNKLVCLEFTTMLTSVNFYVFKATQETHSFQAVHKLVVFD